MRRTSIQVETLWYAREVPVLMPDPPSYPCATGLSAEDGPLDPLDSPPQLNQTEQQDAASFQMYLFWNAGIGSGSSASILVPLGSISWNIAGDIV
jgi:hypothetical protein